MIWIILIVLGILYFIFDKVFVWDVFDELFRGIILTVSICLILIVFLCMFCTIDNKNQFMITNKNIEIKKEMLKQINDDYYKLNQSGKFINIENNNYMQEKLKIQTGLFEDVKSFNSSLAFAKFRQIHKFWFIGFNKDYNEFEYLDLK